VRSFIKGMTVCAVAGAGLAGSARASEVLVSSDISTSTTWTANNTYNLQQQIYVLPGATLTIEAGTVVASTTDLGGSLAVCKGAQIFVNGTRTDPVIMTSTDDVATWVGGNPKTGTWRAACNEWGNLTVMGDAYISSNNHGNGTPNSPIPSATNTAAMEGLIAGFPGDPKVLYGGGNDDDDSGTITYVSLRYGGKVVALNNELNGLSMGGIGRNTTVHHVDIMNNVDDGIETWGGTVNYKYLNIWNIGDDSFDTDEGWRGKAQFGLLVKGYSRVAATGSGVGDHDTEMDGAEDSDWQPVSTNVIYNFTCIGQPLNPRGSTAWRDNNRTQFHNCIFMDGGGEVVKFDNSDGDGAHGYGFNGTLDWPTTWTTAYNAVPPTPNDFPSGSYASHYPSQTSGNLIEFTDNVFFRNLNANAYTEATARGVFNLSENNVVTPGSADSSAPIKSITRGPAVPCPGYNVLPVISLDPRPANDALTSIGMAPADGFFTPAQYRGAFAPNAQSWLCDWTASFAFGFTTVCDPGVPFCFGDGTGHACPCGNSGAPGHGCENSSTTGGALLTAAGFTDPDDVVLTSSDEKPTAFSVFIQGPVSLANPVNFGDGVRCVGGSLKRLYIKSASGGVVSAPGPGDPSITARSAALGDTIAPGSSRYYQVWYRDPASTWCPSPPGGTSNVSNGYQIVW
jgi:hypothetical protein